MLCVILETCNDFLFQLEYGNRELMTNMETHGTAVYTTRQYYQPSQYVEDTVQSLDFVEVCKVSFHLKSYIISGKLGKTGGLVQFNFAFSHVIIFN